MRFLVTGANGFVGRPLCAKLLRRGQSVCAAVRSAGTQVENIEVVQVGLINGKTDWTDALRDIDVVIHLAARVHVMHDNTDDPLAEFRRVNTVGTECLARSAAASGVKRLVYVSSIKVNGEETPDGQSYSEQDVPAPQDPYGISKWEAEQALHRVVQETGLEVVIVRPTLVYGPGVKGNFTQMMRAVAHGIPLPFAASHNQRDLIYVGNLVDALIACATHPAAAGQTYLVSDGEFISTPDLLRCLADEMGVPSRVFPFPAALLKLAGKLTGKSAQIERLLGSLRVDSGKIRRELGWQPPYTLEQGLHATVVAFAANHFKTIKKS
ncbi:MAG TPA: SDR family oxidoreductase [Gallionella sp.]|nr:SDR family oxidoreductase [Gallionella sp.]